MNKTVKTIGKIIGASWRLCQDILGAASRLGTYVSFPKVFTFHGGFRRCGRLD